MRSIFTLFLFSFCFQSLAQEKLVTINGSNYRVYLKGFENRAENSPAIIFESGMGSELGNWDTVIDEISSFAPVFAYDRAGIGKSDQTFEMPTPKLVSENLQSILKTLQIDPPYILVGHSLGGVYIRSFAGYYPDEIAALVFIDPADFTETKQDWNAIFKAMDVPERKIDEMLYTRLYSPAKVDSVNFGPWSEGQVLRELRRTDFASLTELPLPSVPIYFFVGGKFEVPVDRRSKDFDQEAFFHIKNHSNMERWKKLSYSTGQPGALIYLIHAGHYIHRDDPQAIIFNLRILTESLK
jgi:pimeloyl-ACP methyl ester carboxylesterase